MQINALESTREELSVAAIKDKTRIQFLFVSSQLACETPPAADA